jgi:hypothetical protein
MELQGRKGHKVQLALRVLMVLTVQLALRVLTVLMVLTVQLAHKGRKAQLALKELQAQLAHKGRQDLQVLLALRDQTLPSLVRLSRQQVAC